MIPEALTVIKIQQQKSSHYKIYS